MNVAAEAPIPAGTVVVTGGRAGFAQVVLVDTHRLSADEPVAAGGTNTGPTPYDLLVAALGACTSMTIRLYAARKKWPLEEVTVRLRHSRVHAIDCAECETKEGRIDQVDCEIALTGAMSDEQRSKCLEIAERCPVHRTLTSEVNIRTALR